MHTKRLFLFAIAVLAALVIGEVAFIIKSEAIAPESEIQSYAREVLAACSKERYRRACYEREIPRLADILSMQETFQVVTLIQEDDQELLHCHTVGHYIADKEVRKDPAQWQEVLGQCPVHLCNNGCMHGALMTRYVNEVLNDEQMKRLRPELEGVCVSLNEGNNHAQATRAICYHGLGHLFVYITGADIQQSVSLCRDTVTVDENGHLRSCLQGVFMTVYQPIDAEARALVGPIRPTSDMVGSFCAPYEGLAADMCRVESWVLFADQLDNPKKVPEFCSFSSDEEIIRSCYITVLNWKSINTLLTGDNYDAFAQYCQALPATYQTLCFSEGAVNYVEASRENVDKAVTICRRASGDNYETCMRQVAVYAPRVYIAPDQSALLEYCTALPEPWDTACLEQAF